MQGESPSLYFHCSRLIFSQSRSKPCLHSLFVMHKVFRVPTDNPLCWQHALIDPEIEQLIRGRFNSDIYVNRRKKPAECASNAAPADVPQKQITEEDSCPICMEGLLNCGQPLDWCRGGCGNSIHEECLKILAQHKKSTGDDNSCPLCRCKWRDKPKVSSAAAIAARAAFTGSHPRTKCMVCKASPISGVRFRCVTCVDYDMCSSCFAGPRHREHPFVQRQSPSHEWQAAARPSEVAAALAAAALDLQSRDLSPSDYDLLLSLDNAASRALHSHLVSSLPDAPIQAAAESQNLCVFCETPVHRSSAAAAVNPKKLPCNRLCHTQCVESAVAHGDLSCPHCRC
jgi:E3 ubiquitin-protein ligase ZSWIM2